MRSKLRQIFSSVRQQLLFILFCIFGTILISVNAEDIPSDSAENSVGTRIYYTTIPIDRSNGPFLRQLKILIPNVPSPYNDTKNYDGDTWEVLVDKLLTKKDSVQRDGRSRTQVIVPLPAACFDTGLSSDKKDLCLNDPKGFAKGFISLKLYDVKAGETLADIFSRHGVYPNRDGSPYFNQQRWPDVVQNFNPRIRQWTNLPAGAVFVLPLVTESGSRAHNVMSPSDVDVKTQSPDVEQPSMPAAESRPDETMSTGNSNPTVLPNPEEKDKTGTSEVEKNQVEPVTPDVVSVTPARPTVAPVAGPVLPPQNQIKPPVQNKPEPVLVEEKSPEPEPPPQTVRKNKGERLATSDLSIGWGRNVLSSAKIPMVAKQNSLNLAYTRSDLGNSSDWWLGVNYLPKTTATSASKYLIDTDDPNEFFMMSSVDYGVRFHLTGYVPNWSLFAGIYVRLISVNVRMYIDNESDEATYLLERNTKNNLGMGFNAGVDHTAGARRYRLSITKDLYEFVDNSAQIDRTNARFIASFNSPATKESGKVQRHFDLIMESETVNVNVVSEAVLLQGTLKRFSFGVGAGLVW